MTSISQRELRNDNAAIMRAVKEGATFTVTRRGVPVATLGPITYDSGLRCVRPATARLTRSMVRSVRRMTPTAAVVDDLRGDR